MRLTIILALLETIGCASESQLAPPPSAPAKPTVVAAGPKAEQALIEGDYVTAILRADEVLAWRPGDAWALYDKGAALAALGRVDEALTVLRRAERAFPVSDVGGRSVAIWRRALVLEFAGRCGEASTEFANYAAAVGASDPSMGAQVFAHLRFCVPTSERQPIAEWSDPSWQKAQRASTAAVEALARGDNQTALARADEGLAIRPDDGWLLYNKGTALSGLGRTDEALGLLLRAEGAFMAEDPHAQSVAAFRRAFALELAGRCEEARLEYDRWASMVKDREPLAAQHAAAHVKFCLAATKTL